MKLACYLVLVLAAVAAIGCTSKQERARREGTALYVRGADAYRQGNVDSAQASLKQAVALDPQLTMARSLLGDLYREEGDYRAALEQYQVVVKLDPYTADNHYYLGVCYHFLQRLTDAAAAYAQAIKLDPNDAAAHMNLGLVHLAMNDLDRAVQYTQRAVQLDPKSPVALANYGVALDATGDYQAAEQAYRRSLELDSSQAVTLLNLGSNLIEQGKAQEAINVMTQAVKRVNSAWSHKRYGDAYLLAGQLDAAEREYQASLKLNAQYYPAMNELGRVFMMQYEQGLQLNQALPGKAVAVWRESLKLKPDQPRIAALIDQVRRNHPGL